jgi:predicted O-methyltransferase YrrM
MIDYQEAARVGHEKGIHVHQNYYEFTDWLNVLAEIRPVRGLEIGTYFFGSSRLTLELLPGIDYLLTVDIENRLTQQDFREVVAGYEGRLWFLHGDSTSPSVHADVQAVFADEPADFAFVDGAHDAATLVHDFALALAVVRPGGLIAFHDCTIPLAQDVVDFWGVLAAAHPERCRLLRADGRGGEEYGIGVYRVPERP